MATVFYKRVPKELSANLRYRIALRQRAENDLGFRDALMSACRADALYFFNSFAWLYEPRPRRGLSGNTLPLQIPFITWPHQDKAILEIKEAWGFEDFGVEKARGEGASWICLLLSLHDWLFEPLSAIGFVSRTENAVDSPDDSDSIFWKLDWSLTKLPHWMQPPSKRNTSLHTLKNLANGSMITGYSATGDVASGGRKKVFIMDELAKFPRGADSDAMASTQHVTNCRGAVSTPKGSDGEYHKLMHEPSSMIKVVLDWRDNPTRNQGLYEFRDGRPSALDQVNNPLPTSYDPPSPAVKDLFSRLRRKGYKLEGRVRSPWYDHECDRPGATPQKIAQELDRDYGGSMFRVFGNEFFSAAQEKVRQPMRRGMLTFHPETLEPQFETSDDGPLLLWMELDHENRPPPHQYAIGADIATGLGGSYTSNSVSTGIDLVTGQQVYEFALNTIDPQDFADFNIAIAKWLYDAYLAWEANGSAGGAFTKRVLHQKYANIYYRKLLWKRSKNKTKEAGWWTDERSKGAMLGEVSRSVKSGELILYSDMLVKECGQYVYINGSVQHASEKTADDSSTGKAHGDRVIAMAVARQAAIERPLASDVLKDYLRDNQPENSVGGRQHEWEEAQKKREDDWDDRELSDLASPTQEFRWLAKTGDGWAA